MDRKYASQSSGFKTKPCRYAANCRKGDQCRFSHALQGPRQPLPMRGPSEWSAAWGGSGDLREEPRQPQPFPMGGPRTGWSAAWGGSGDLREDSPQKPEPTMQWSGMGGNEPSMFTWQPPWRHAGRSDSLYLRPFNTPETDPPDIDLRFSRQSTQDQPSWPAPMDATVGNARFLNKFDKMEDSVHLPLRRFDTPDTDIPNTDLSLSRLSTQDSDKPWPPLWMDGAVRKALSSLDATPNYDGASRQCFNLAPSELPDLDLRLSRQTTQEEGSPADGAASRAKRNKFYKIRMCKYYALGQCVKGEACNFGHSQDELQPLPNLRCTKLCPEWLQAGACSKGESCRYAHSTEELRQDESKKARLRSAEHLAEEEQAPQEVRRTELLAEGLRAATHSIGEEECSGYRMEEINQEPYVRRQVDGGVLAVNSGKYSDYTVFDPSPCPSSRATTRASFLTSPLRSQDNHSSAAPVQHEGPPLCLKVKNTFLSTEPFVREPSHHRSQSVPAFARAEGAVAEEAWWPRPWGLPAWGLEEQQAEAGVRQDERWGWRRGADSEQQETPYGLLGYVPPGMLDRR